MRFAVIMAGVMLIFLGCAFVPWPALAEDPEGVLSVLPDDLFSRKDIPEPCPRFGTAVPKRYMIFWNDRLAIDGDFILVIHPTQLFLRSSHDNPNPDLIYWFSSLSPAQYKAISLFLDRYAGAVFDSRDVWEWPGYRVFHLNGARQSPGHTDQEENEWQRKRRLTTAGNMNRIFGELNRAMPKGVRKLAAPEADALSKFIYIADERMPR